MPLGATLSSYWQTIQGDLFPCLREALGPPPFEATHWTGRMLAKEARVSLRSVQRILEAPRLAPHRIRTFKLSKDPEFAAKLRDIVGLYVDPPAHAFAAHSTWSVRSAMITWRRARYRGG
jgi:hypothetical protein